MSQPTRECPTCHTPLPGMAAFCYVCGTATPPGIHRDSGQTVVIGKSGIGPVDLTRKLQRALGPGYELGERIGAGGFAEVFRVRDLRLKRDLAAKVLRPDLGLSPDLLQRFRREAETIATLRNPHIVPVYDIGEAEGLAFIIMPLIEGESLRATLDRDGPLPADEVRRILAEAASGLAAAHEAGVIHRDIKPENIMLEGKDKRVLLMDFGIAKAISGDETDPGKTLTTTGIIIGTPQYMSPEQACGDKTIDARTDQYSLGVVAYRMLAGALPFEGESTRAVLYQQLVAEPPPIAAKVPGVPESLAHAIERAMAKEPADRFASMLEFAAALEAASPGSTSMRSQRMPKPKVATPRKPLLVGGSVAAVIAVAAMWYLVSPKNADGITPPIVTTPPVVVQPAPVAVLPPPPSPAATTVRNTKTPANPPATSTTTTAPPVAGAAATTTAAPAGPSCARAATTVDWKTAATVCPKEAAAGGAAAQRILGAMYEKGTGVPADPVQAVAWYQKAVKQNDHEAQYLLGHMYEIGAGVKQSDAEALTYLQESAAGQFLKAEQELAYRYENGGSGIKKDQSTAAHWYRNAAEQHHDPASEMKLADMLVKGSGVPKNETEALDWYKQAANQGSGDAAWKAAEIYLKGSGPVKKDSAQGMDWLRKAAAKNQPDAVKELKKRTG